MDKFTEEQHKEANAFSTFYFDLVENHRESLVFYLSDGAVLDWFGKTIKGTPKISEFIKSEMGKLTHDFPTIEPCHSIGYRDSHVIDVHAKVARAATSVKRTPQGNPEGSQEKTPPNNCTITASSSSRKREKGQGDGLHNCTSESPTKRTRLGSGDAIETQISAPMQIVNISSAGHVQFHGKSSKKYQKETKWSRPCKFQAAYSKTPAGYLIHLIIYQGNLRCKRNLLKDFDAVSSPD